MSSPAGVSGMEHVLLLTDDIERSREFYCQVLGLRVGDRPPLQFPGYWLYAGATACLHIAQRDPYQAHAAELGLSVSAIGGIGGSLDHIAFNAGDYEDADARLAREGVSVIRNDVPGGGPRQLFFADPDGTRIEINFKRTETK
jgi:catechol 2,3-dioxygenase-like lactoylglutathione lyase family enzyme